MRAGVEENHTLRENFKRLPFRCTADFLNRWRFVVIQGRYGRTSAFSLTSLLLSCDCSPSYKKEEATLECVCATK